MHDTTDNECTLCPTFRSNLDPRTPDRWPVCEGCRLRLSRLIGELHDLHERLANPEPAEAGRRRYQRLDTQGRAETVWADPLATIGGSGPIPSKPDQPHVSGTPSKSTPANLDHIDLTNEARIPNPTPQARKHPWDQIGNLSVATRLDEVVRDWRDTLWPGHHLPPPTVPELVMWLRAGHTPEYAGNRVDEACTGHPGIADTAAELHQLRGTLRAALGETDPRPRHWLGVDCPHCHEISTIQQAPGDDYAECGNCGRMYTGDQMAEIVHEQAAAART
ncbi:hypothetical protein GCM10011608_09760 [Micromonospora sonchi]|uniref:Uncharacterized protein n=1 Tax=Micromonospora sonchi TaxID=1763543 RepID=A0A917TKN2_9ACTN|nr:hypothetical protein [Micromonospora sonchi]GGM26992.1 hypothetical protein GCM10011608_09760 [Micromonospora sonchi]